MLKLLTNISLLLLTISTLVYSQPATIDHSIFDKLLKENVNDEGKVDYDAFSKSKDFKNYLNQIAAADLSGLNKNELLAFYINAYNALVIKNVIDNMPVKSPLDVEGFFKAKKFKIAGEELTLDEIEHDLVLKIEPVLSHFGLVCGALSCPKLLRKTYSGDNVYNLLKENATEFIYDTSKNRLDKENKILYLSEIFKWFKRYFEEKYGSVLNAVKSFINKNDKNFLDQNEVKIKFLPYNWQLNKQ